MASTMAHHKHADNLNPIRVFRASHVATPRQQSLICGVTVMVE